MTTHPLINQTVLVTKGCKAFAIDKNTKGKVTAVNQLGPEYSHAVEVLISFNGRVRNFYARHLNRLSEAQFHLNKGNPLNRITVRPSGGLPTGVARSVQS